MAKTTDQLIHIMESGGAVSIDIKALPFEKLIQLAQVSSSSGNVLWLKNSEKRTTKQLVELSKYNLKNNIVFSIDS